jgi:hypothetical protein
MENRPNFTKKMSRTDILREVMQIQEQTEKALRHLDATPPDMLIAKLRTKDALILIERLSKLI